MKRSIIKKISNYDLIIIFLFTLIIAAVFVARSFYSLRNLSSILKLSTLVGIAALGECMVIITKGIDISVGAVMGITSVIAAMIIEPLGVVAAIIIPLLACGIIGFINGLIIVKGKIPALVTTIGMMWTLRGVASILTSGRPIRITNENMTSIASASIYKVIPYFFIGLVIASLILHLVLNNLKIGKHIFAIGGNEDAAYYSGLKIDKTRIFVYMFAAIFYGIAGLFMASYIRVGSHSLAGGYEFRAITAVAFAGVALSGGKGNILKVLLGAVFLTVLYSLLINFRISPYLQGLFEGAILIGAVYLCQKK